MNSRNREALLCVLIGVASTPWGLAMPATAPTPKQIQAALNAAHASYKDIEEGANADYIPALARVDPRIYALLGLLIAFTFSGAAARFDTRRELIVEEANAIGTAYLRLDLLPSEAQASLKGLFREYVSTRLEVYRKLPDIAAAREELARSTKMQTQIWQQSVAACRASDYQEYPRAGLIRVEAFDQALVELLETMT